MKRLRSFARFVSVAFSVLLVVWQAAVRDRRRAALRPVPSPAVQPVATAEERAAPTAPERELFPDEVRIEGQTIELPVPSVRPMTVACGVALLMFGLIASRGFVLVGVLVLVWGVLGWIGELRHGRER